MGYGSFLNRSSNCEIKKNMIYFTIAKAKIPDIALPTYFEHHNYF